MLLTSYTNSAVDNVLLKLRAAGVDFLRLGRAASVHAGVSDALPGGPRHPAATVAALRQLSATARVVSSVRSSVTVAGGRFQCSRLWLVCDPPSRIRHCNMVSSRAGGPCPGPLG